jgi:putative toxin-antitoxin system antitoxin component (TIGR02293 family)
MLEIVERQLPTSAINRLVALGVTRPEIDSLVIPLRTLQHRRSRREKLTVEESDRVLRVARLLSQAKSVYESRERALAWLRRPHPRLRGRTPLETLKTDTGSRLVEELLVQIDEGMFV